MKTLSAFSTLALAAGILSCLFAGEASAKAMNFAHPADSTVIRLADQAEAVVVGRITGVESVAAPVVADNINFRDGATHKRVGDGSFQDGEEGILRRAVLRVSETLKGAGDVVDNELRFVSIRQLKYPAYDSALKDGQALYFIGKRADGELYVISNERGIVTPADAGGTLSATVDFMNSYIAAASANLNARFAVMKAAIFSSLTLDGQRLSQDCAFELSWNFTDYEGLLTPQDKGVLLQLALASHAGSTERPELITTIGRYKPAGAMDALFTLVYADLDFSTTSLCAWSMEKNDRLGAITRLVEDYFTATDNQKIAIVRALGLIRPKADYDGEGMRQQALTIVGGLLNSTTPEALLLEALIASRDLRAEEAHVVALKALIDNRATNGISDKVLKGAIVALSAARIQDTTAEGVNKDQLYAKDYLIELGVSAPDLKQFITAALKSPWTTLIVDGSDRNR